MLKERKYCVWLLLVIACCPSLYGQIDLSAEQSAPNLPADTLASLNGNQPTGSPAAFTIRHIHFEGNKRTRTDFMLREIPFKQGDSYTLQVLIQKFEDARRQLMNTTLFNDVVVALKSFDGYDVDVLVQVKERWYIFPLPYVKPVDRNLNQWIFEQKASLSRVNYGIKLIYNNTTGRNDDLSLWAMTGYTKQLSFGYDRLYIDKRMKWGMNVMLALGANKEINYKTEDNKQLFLKDEKYVRHFFRTALEATYRRAIKTRHRIGVGYTTERISDTVLGLNPGYFKDERKSVYFPEVYYQMTYFDLDYIPYPTRGYAAEVGVAKKGFNKALDLWEFNAKGLGAWPAGKKSFFTLAAQGVLKLPFDQPFYTRRLMGYGTTFMQGYEYYVVDGVAGGFLQTTFTRRLLSFDIRIPIGKSRPPLFIPIKVYGKVFTNAGFVYDPEPGLNFLANQMLYSGGVGIDIFSLYDVTFRIEWSFNQLGQNGVFLHRNSIF